MPATPTILGLDACPLLAPAPRTLTVPNTLRGHARLRRLLYMPALAGPRWNPVLRAQAARLAARGKTGTVMVGALMRKRLRLCVGVLKSRSPGRPAAGAPAAPNSP